jgi:hypothetical protein
MRSLLRGIARLLFVLALAFPSSVGAQETRVVSGVVVDAESGAPVSGALVTIRGTGLSVVTDPEGRFEVSGVPLGGLQLVLRHVAYGEHAQPLVVEASGSLDFRIRVSSRAIELAPLGVEVRSSDAQAQRASGTANNVIDRATIEAFVPGGLGLLPLLQGRIPSLRVDANCVEYRVFQRADVRDPENPEWLVSTGCRDITVYLDGVPDRDGSALLRQLSPEDVERIQVLSPAEAGLRYMNGSRGVVLIETRRGVVADSPGRVHINGFEWKEPESYPWLRVLGVSALGNAAVAGITSRTVFDCGSQESGLTPIRCQAPAGIAGAVLTSVIGRVITRRAGRTPYTEGRTYPAFLMSAATASIGYMLYVHGENQGSDGSRLAGQIVLAVGVPITLTLSDRIFRMLR